MPANLGARLRLLDTTEPVTIDFGDHLRNARTHAGANQAELAAELGISRTTLVEWEQGRSVPIRGIVIAIAVLTGYKVSTLLEAWEPAWAQQAGNDKRRSGGPFKGDKTLRRECHLQIVDDDYIPSQDDVCAQSTRIDDVASSQVI